MAQAGVDGSGADQVDRQEWTEIGVVSVDDGYLVVADGTAEEALLSIPDSVPYEAWDDAVSKVGGCYLPTGGDGDFGVDRGDGLASGTIAIRVDTYGPVSSRVGSWRTHRIIPVPSGRMLFGDLPLIHRGYRLDVDVPAGSYVLQLFYAEPDGLLEAGITGIRLLGPIDDSGPDHEEAR